MAVFNAEQNVRAEEAETRVLYVAVVTAIATFLLLVLAGCVCIFTRYSRTEIEELRVALFKAEQSRAKTRRERTTRSATRAMRRGERADKYDMCDIARHSAASTDPLNHAEDAHNKGDVEASRGGGGGGGAGKPHGGNGGVRFATGGAPRRHGAPPSEPPRDGAPPPTTNGATSKAGLRTAAVVTARAPDEEPTRVGFQHSETTQRGKLVSLAQTPDHPTSVPVQPGQKPGQEVSGSV